MAFHLVAYFEAIDSTADTDVNAVADGILNVQNNHITPFKNMGLIATYAASATLTRARVNSPKVRQIAPSAIRPTETSLLPPNDPGVQDRRFNPFILIRQEEIAVEATSAIAMGTENFHALLWLEDAREEAMKGDVTTLLVTTFTGASVANAWTTSTPTFQTTPPQGIYEVIGGEVQSATITGFRLTFDNQYWRAGGLGITAVANRTWLPQYNGGLGVWGRFDTVTLPRFEVFTNAAETPTRAFLEIVRIGNGFLRSG